MVEADAAIFDNKIASVNPIYATAAYTESTPAVSSLCLCVSLSVRRSSVTHLCVSVCLFEEEAPSLVCLCICSKQLRWLYDFQ